MLALALLSSTLALSGVPAPSGDPVPLAGLTFRAPSGFTHNEAPDLRPPAADVEAPRGSPLANFVITVRGPEPIPNGFDAYLDHRTRDNFSRAYATDVRPAFTYKKNGLSYRFMERIDGSTGAVALLVAATNGSQAAMVALYPHGAQPTLIGMQEGLARELAEGIRFGPAPTARAARVQIGDAEEQPDAQMPAPTGRTGRRDELAGVYTRNETSRHPGLNFTSYITLDTYFVTFSGDGRFMWAKPNSPLDRFDWNAGCRNTACGVYTLKGTELTLKLPGKTPSTLKVNINSTTLELDGVRWEKLVAPRTSQLVGEWEHINVFATGTSESGYNLDSSGHFHAFGDASVYLTQSNAGRIATAGRASGRADSGTYEIRGAELILHTERGSSIHELLLPAADAARGAKPEEIVVDGEAMLH